MARWYNRWFGWIPGVKNAGDMYKEDEITYEPVKFSLDEITGVRCSNIAERIEWWEKNKQHYQTP